MTRLLNGEENILKLYIFAQQNVPVCRPKSVNELFCRNVKEARSNRPGFMIVAMETALQ